MTDHISLEAFLDAAHIDDAVFALRPDYRAVLIAAEGSNLARPTTRAKR